MKNSLFIVPAFAFLAITGLSNCNNTLETSKEKVEKADEDLQNAKKQHEIQVAKHRAESTEKIEQNKVRIADFNARIVEEKKEVRADYQAKIKELENKNTDMKKRLDEFKSDNAEGWETFKNEFNKDMDDLADALINFTKSDKK